MSRNSVCPADDLHIAMFGENQVVSGYCNIKKQFTLHIFPAPSVMWLCSSA